MNLSTAYMGTFSMFLLFKIYLMFQTGQENLRIFV